MGCVGSAERLLSTPCSSAPFPTSPPSLHTHLQLQPQFLTLSSASRRAASVLSANPRAIFAALTEGPLGNLVSLRLLPRCGGHFELEGQEKDDVFELCTSGGCLARVRNAGTGPIQFTATCGITREYIWLLGVRGLKSVGVNASVSITPLQDSEQPATLRATV